MASSWSWRNCELGHKENPINLAPRPGINLPNNIDDSLTNCPQFHDLLHLLPKKWPKYRKRKLQDIIKIYEKSSFFYNYTTAWGVVDRFTTSHRWCYKKGFLCSYIRAQLHNVSYHSTKYFACYYHTYSFTTYFACYYVSTCRHDLLQFSRLFFFFHYLKSRLAEGLPRSTLRHLASPEDTIKLRVSLNSEVFVAWHFHNNA
jgi:hypothetical protein